MTAQVSIWRWAVTDDLETRFARLVGASGAEFVQIASGMAAEGSGSAPSLDDVERETVARFREMDLPADVLDTMLKGFRTMLEEARAEETDETDELPNPDGQVSVALASSHMFHDAPYASLGHAEIERQVQALMASYRIAVTKAVGHQGQGLAAFIGLSDEEMARNDVVDMLTEAGMEGVEWVWVMPETAFFLSRWREDQTLPIDLEFSRAPLDALKALTTLI